jgi:prepilin-type N-terminal cleavage/methylation domain-containing protein/prepilin-type processing-associated H-X9-DG protein
MVTRGRSSAESRSRRSGFTLIELLVVIAIIGILAAMLFPVFARAREAARKTQCLANVRNIAMGVQIYLTDYDSFPPKESRAEVVNFFNQNTGGCCCQLQNANPYLKWPVVLDEYIKSREVWRCPSGRYYQTAAINPCPNGDWFGWLLASPNAQWGGARGVMGCSYTYPPGWGGNVTDSLVQDAKSSDATGGFVETVGYPEDAIGRKTSSINDPATYVVCADAGGAPKFLRTSEIAYPDIVGLYCAACSREADWANCSWTLQCGAGDPRFATDPEYRKQHAMPRHLGGSNVGFADGHAKWSLSEAILFSGQPSDYPGQTAGKTYPILFDGVQSCGFGPPK